ncbi:class I SAM-dependent methyltransferase [Sphingobacteriales bacterium UPWRP_1]|nr:class I SAM-dependent methyltransferase [Sphingobacteriales bacterium UPWRP_1]
MDTDRNRNIQNHFNNEAVIYDHVITTVIPFYSQMIQTVVQNIPFAPHEPLKIADLGCGTGTLSAAVKQHFTNARLVCYDFSENMLQQAKQNLSNFEGVQYLLAEFNTMRFEPQAPFHAIVSSLALHHLETDEDKRRFYRKVYEALLPGGVFINADAVLSAHNEWQNTNIALWKQFMRRFYPDDEIENRWFERFKHEDRPAVLMHQLQWFTQTGFSYTDVFWKYGNFAVYGAVK